MCIQVHLLATHMHKTEDVCCQCVHIMLINNAEVVRQTRHYPTQCDSALLFEKMQEKGKTTRKSLFLPSLFLSLFFFSPPIDTYSYSHL